MKFSIFTPTHDTKYLLDTYESIKAQTHFDWEWVIVPNNGAVMPVIDDARVHVIPAPKWMESLGVGALKRFACEQCSGEYLVEVDHDDLLLPNALASIEAAVDVHAAEFLYSDCANFRANGEYELYDKVYGWEHYSHREAEVVHQVNRSFPITPSALHAIFFAPNHVRVWKKTAYWNAGGHDSSMGVCDDYDLVCKTYLSGAKFHHISELLYLYRLQADGGNTWLKRNAEIQRKQAEVSLRYMHPIIHEWCRRENLPKVDLGGGIGCPEGFIAADLKTGFDLRQKWPFGDSSVGCVRAYDFLEHIPHCRDSACKHEPPYCSVGVMNEVYRVLVPGGWLLSATPSTDGRGAFQDPTHCSYWNSNSAWYYTRRQQQQYVPGIVARFQAGRIANEFPSDWHKLHNILYVYMDLCALKGQRQPGICEV